MIIHDDATEVATSEMDREDELVLPAPADPFGDARRQLAEQLVEEARTTPSPFSSSVLTRVC